MPTMDAHSRGTQSQPGANSRAMARAAIRFLILILLTLGVPFLAAGRLDWWPAWVLAAMNLASIAISRIIPARRNPDLLAERAQASGGEGGKSWDRVLMPLVALYAPLLIWVTAGLSERYGWLPRVPLWAQAAGFLAFAAGSAFASWAFVANRFFSTVVRIQSDRGQTVVTGGPYRFVRHPGYAGGALLHLASAPALGSLWALIPAALTIALIILRTALEDRTLHDELVGYRDYAARVRYRLLPGVW